MLRKTVLAGMWVGGAAAQPSLSRPLRSGRSQFVSAERDIVAGGLPSEARRIVGIEHPNIEPFTLNARVYDELLKLPLRFALHPYDVVEAHLARYGAGYAPPLGAADPDDVIPFHVHRMSTGALQGKMESINARALAPSFYTKFRLIDGDMFRFEDELIKIFPTKKTFVRNHEVVVYNTAKDAINIVHHWYVGLGF